MIYKKKNYCITNHKYPNNYISFFDVNIVSLLIEGAYVENYQEPEFDVQTSKLMKFAQTDDEVVIVIAAEIPHFLYFDVHTNFNT